MAASLIEYHRRDLRHSTSVVPFERHLPLTAAAAPAPLVVADQRSLAALFALPWRRGPATLVVQNVGGALVLDGGDAGPGAAAAAACRGALPDETDARTPAERTRAALLACAALARESATPLAARRREEAARAARVARALAPAADERDASYATPPHAPYARVRRWRLGDLQLLSGSDCALLGGGRCALRLARADALRTPGQRRLAALDCWLDAILTGAPRVALCVADGAGVVVGGRVVDVCDVPHTLAGRGERALFDIRALNEDATQLLRFLAAHCGREGATYVLTTRGAGTPLELYDVNRLADTSRRHWKWLLATLAARVARRLGAHLRGAGDAPTCLRARHGALIDSALELLGEVRDLGGAAHDALRASLHEAGALAQLPGYARAPRRPTGARRFFGAAGGDGPAPGAAGYEGLGAFDAPTLERARRRFAAAGLGGAAADCALALAKAHLDAHRPAELMHELRRCLGAAEISQPARAAGLRHVACAFAHEAAREPHEWCARGAVAGDARKLLEDVAEGLGGDLEAGVAARAARAARAAAANAHDDGVAPRFRGDAEGLRRAAARADACADAPPAPALVHAVALAVALEDALGAARAAFGPAAPEAVAVAARLGAAQAAAGAELSRAGHDAAGAWLHAAVCRLHAAASVDNEARVRLELALAAKRAAAAALDGGDPRDATSLARDAQRCCEAALEALGPRDGPVRAQAHAEVASCALLEALAAAKTGRDAEAAFDRAVRVAATARGAACARLQRGRFLASLPGTARRHATRTQDLACAAAALRDTDAGPAADAALALAALADAPGDLLLAVRALAQTLKPGDAAHAAALADAARRLLASTRVAGSDAGAAAAQTRCKAAYGAALRGDAAGVAAALEPLFSPPGEGGV